MDQGDCQIESQNSRGLLVIGNWSRKEVIKF
jgi:hypothetical protein